MEIAQMFKLLVCAFKMVPEGKKIAIFAWLACHECNIFNSQGKQFNDEEQKLVPFNVFCLYGDDVVRQMIQLSLFSMFGSGVSQFNSNRFQFNKWAISSFKCF